MLPGLDTALAAEPLMAWENRDSKALKLFRDAGGCGLLVPTEHGGHGVDPVAAVRVQRAIGARSPSLAVATTMHHFSVASLAELSAPGHRFRVGGAAGDRRAALVPQLGVRRGQPEHEHPGAAGAGPQGRGRSAGQRQQAAVQPDLVDGPDVGQRRGRRQRRADGGPEKLAIVLIPATDPGISRRPFWESFVLAGAESDEVILTDVFVPDMMVFHPAEATMTDPIQGRGFHRGSN